MKKMSRRISFDERALHLSGWLRLVAVGLTLAACNGGGGSDLAPAMAGNGSGGGTAGSAAGGSTSTAGSMSSGGSAGLPEIKVADCNSLAAVGVWERIQPAGLKTGPTAFVVDPVNLGTIYLGTGDGCQGGQCDGLFKSEDCGSTWKHVSTGTLSQAINGGIQWTFEIDPTDPKILYTNSGYGALGLYKSIDGGVNWTEITPKNDGAPGFVSRTQMDPANPKHILLDWHNECKGANGNSPAGCFAETKDGGATWKMYYSSDAPWVAEANVYLLNTLTWVVASNGFYRTTDGGATWAKLPQDVIAGGHSAGRLYRAKDSAFYMGTTAGVIRSTWAENGSAWKLIPNTGSWVFGMTGDGKDIFAGGQAGFMKTAESDGLTWTLMEGSAKHSDGCSGSVDTEHNLLYASCGIDGFHRVRVR